MNLITLLIVILLVLLLTGVWGHRTGWYGSVPAYYATGGVSIVAVILVVLLILLLLGRI